MSEAKPLVYLLEDEPSIRELLSFNLSALYEVRGSGNGRELFAQLHDEKRPVALFILDVMLPGEDGFQVCESLRSDPDYQLSSFLFLTARSHEEDKLLAFERGADDYLTKPFGMRELLARVRALVQRWEERQALARGESPLAKQAAKSPDADQATRQLCYGRLLMDDEAHRVFVGGREIEMTQREYELLRFLMRNPEHAFSRGELLNRVWGFDYDGESRTVDVHIRQLRRKVEENPSDPQLIQTVRGHGYRFSSPRG